MQDEVKQEDVSIDQQESCEYKDRYIRLLAEFDNYKRRRNAEDQELSLFAKQVAIVKLLPSLDSLQAIFKSFPSDMPEQFKQWYEGLVSASGQLDKALAELSVTRIPTIDQKFDPSIHEAVRVVSGESDDIVVEEYQTGYRIGEMVIRPAQVAISKVNN